ncbi:MAG: hypothetical protein J5892_00130 [Bacilli bacterium]|nr:hypothetical protein [Bacilli bacterium]
MQKFTKFIKNNIKIVIGFILGGILFGGVTFTAASSGNASGVTYTTSGTTTTVQAKIDELYGKTSSWFDVNNMSAPTNYLFDDHAPDATSPLFPPEGKRVYLAYYPDGNIGVCIFKDNEQHCFRSIEWIAESKHLQSIFPSSECHYEYGILVCDNNEAGCFIQNDGIVNCWDKIEYEECTAGLDNNWCG